MIFEFQNELVIYNIFNWIKYFILLGNKSANSAKNHVHYLYNLETVKTEMLNINLYLTAKRKTDGRTAKNFSCRK